MLCMQVQGLVCDLSEQKSWVELIKELCMIGGSRTILLSTWQHIKKVHEQSN